MAQLVGAMRFVAKTLARGIRPIKPMPFHEWLQKNIVLVDGKLRGEKWSAEEAPYLLEIAEFLSIENPATRGVVLKCQQSGVSILAMSWSLYLAELGLDSILYGIPGKDILSRMNGQKLQPLIDKWQEHTGKRIIKDDISRSGKGSTTYVKKFADSFLTLVNANTPGELSSFTARFGIKDEFSKWKNSPKGDDPDELFEGRFTAFLRWGLQKIFEFSTPEIDSGDETGDDPTHCRTHRSFLKSDQRHWHIQCPNEDCSGDGEFVLDYENFDVDRKNPELSYCFCPDCGAKVYESDRIELVRKGRWIASNPDGKYPGWSIPAFISLQLGLKDIAEALINAEKKGEAALKNFFNLYLARPYAFKGNAPDYQRLMERREDYPQGFIPEAGLIFVGGADVQHNGIYVEAVAFAEDRQSWSIWNEFLEGPTDNHNAGAFVLLDEFYRKTFEDARGTPRRLMALAVDGGDGGRMNQVLEWTKRRYNTFAIKGKDGHHVPAISVPAKQSIRKSGKKKKFGSTMLWPVGTWDLKHEFYGNLHRQGVAAGEVMDPGGYCHFGLWQGEEYFKQITAESFNREVKNHKLVEGWDRLRKDNHFLDCRVYAMAMAEKEGLSSMTPAQWAALRHTLLPAQADLLSSDSAKLAAGLTPTQTEPETVSEAKPAAAEGPTRHGTDERQSSYQRRRQLV
ncbi:Phage terminase, large subunit GpA [Cohaesibacter sp. ES.047]|uniref:terminase gpA endonuclease subunit n=1 Tax=Cohaesibacter sp. ES.047 TaxID=1798205 RepID=UPI000BB85F51|nr:terminase gpA endonuclease subunit [Cohaesibacter sp. ES.047]SNY94072.1 Phage terminase, large subunit GpA [Cohaesibacter sp. ES.047]